MKKYSSKVRTKVGIVLAIAACSAIVAIESFAGRANAIDMTMNDVEALASCEIVKKGQVIYQCVSNDGKCKETKFGYELICEGHHGQ